MQTIPKIVTILTMTLFFFLLGCTDSPTYIIQDINADLNVSSLDTNWQTSWAVFDANMKAEYNLPAVPSSGIDTNWQTSWGVFDANMKAEYNLPAYDTNWQTDFNAFDNNMKGTYLQTETAPLVLPALSGGKYLFNNGTTMSWVALGGTTIPAGVVWDGNNVTRLVNDANYQTYANTQALYQPKGNYLTYSQNDANLLNYVKQVDGNVWYYSSSNPNGYISSYTDTNWQTSWATFDANMSATYQPKGNYLTYAQNDGNLANYTKTIDLNTAIDSGSIIRKNSNISLLTNDSGFITSSSLVPYVLWTDANNVFVKISDLNGYLSNQVCPSGYALSSLGASPVCVLIPSTAGLVSQIDGNAWYWKKEDLTKLSDLSNDLNFQTYAQVLNLLPDTSSFVTETDGNAWYAFKSDVNAWGDKRYYPLSNPNNYISSYLDTNWQTSWSIFDANMSATYQPKGNYLTYAQNDANLLNYYTRSQSDANWNKYMLIGNYMTKTMIDGNGYMTKTQTDGNYVARNNWTTIDNYPSACASGTYASQIGDTLTCSKPQDTNWQNTWSTFDTNMIGTYRKYTVDLNTSQNINSDKNINATTAINIGTNGYILISGSTMIIGMR